MKRQRNVDGNNNINNLTHKIKLVSPKDDEETIGKKIKMLVSPKDDEETIGKKDKKKIVTQIEAFEDHNNEKKINNFSGVPLSSSISISTSLTTCMGNTVSDSCNNCLEEWEESWSSWSNVDEQMWWGSTWSPIWDVEFIGGEACGHMFSDIMWDDDLWNLKSTGNIPNP